MIKRQSTEQQSNQPRKDRPIERRPKSANPIAINHNLSSDPDNDLNSPPIRLKKRLPSAIPTRKTPFSKTSTDGLQSFPIPSRLLPRNIYQDKESLYEELLQCKQQVNVLNEENVRLKTRIAILEKDRRSLRTEIAKGDANSSTTSTDNKLKLLVREIVDQTHPNRPSSYKVLKLQNDKLKRALKVTKTKELEQQNTALYEELTRLKDMLQAQMSTNLMDLVSGENYKVLQQKLAKECAENQRLRSQVPSEKKDHKEQKQPKEQKEQKEHKEQKQGKQIKLRLKNNDKQLKSLKDQLQTLKNTDQIKANDLLKVEIAKLQRELFVQRTVVKGLTEKVTELQRKLITMNVQRKDASCGKTPSPKKPQSLKSQPSNHLIEAQIKEPAQQNSHSQPDLPPLSDQLRSLGYFLTFKFAAQKYTPDDVVNIVMRSKPNSYDNLLLGQPFFMNNEQLKFLFIKRATKNSTRPLTPTAIVEVLCQIVPPYSQFLNDQQLYVGCSEIITMKYNQLMNTLRQFPETETSSSGLLPYELLCQLLTKIGMNQEQIRFVIGEISFFSDDLTSLNYFAMLDKFYIPTEEGGLGAAGFEHSYIQEVPEEFQESSAPQAI